MTDKDDLKENVAKMISELVSGQLSESEGDNVHEEISRLVPDPEWSDYVFHSSDFYRNDQTLDLDAVVEKIFSYQAIKL